MVTIKVKRKKMFDPVTWLRNGSENGLKNVVELIETEAKRLAPVDTGKLKGEIKGKSRLFKGTVESPTSYAVYQEYGTYKMRAANSGRGYLRLAIQNVNNKIFAYFSRGFRRR